MSTPEEIEASRVRAMGLASEEAYALLLGWGGRTSWASRQTSPRRSTGAGWQLNRDIGARWPGSGVSCIAEVILRHDAGSV